ncbi:MAG: hypothetical protein GC138_04650 [Gammaproteobacteria bacterium]|nr:hypothetical protein [Gammaproteobacteria bacterium]
MLKKIISGGQTGVDRAALDVALVLDLDRGGWCPAGRAADDGPIDTKYPLIETSEMDHTVRTGYNVRESDASILIYCGLLQGGTAYAVEMAKHQGKPVKAVDLENPPPPAEISDWIAENGVATLHIGGQREASAPGIYARAYTYIRHCLEDYLDRHGDKRS